MPGRVPLGWPGSGAQMVFKARADRLGFSEPNVSLRFGARKQKSLPAGLNPFPIPSQELCQTALCASLIWPILRKDPINLAIF